jgi:Restriction endonuclease
MHLRLRFPLGAAVIDSLLDRLDRAIFAFVRSVSGRTVALVSLVFYPGLGLIVPLAFDWTRSWLVAANTIGVMGAAMISLGWLIVKVEAKDRRHLLEWTTDLRHLTAEEFEWLVGETFRREGWSVRETGSQHGADGNVDLVLTRDGARRLVQCKRWSSWLIGVNEVRAFAGTLHREQVRDGVLVTFSGFNEHAIREAGRIGLELIDGRELYGRIERVRRPEPCPDCDSPMVLDRSPHGWWFRCVANGCAGKRNLDREPALAVELLTQPPTGGTFGAGR